MAANKTFTELEELTTVDKNNDWMAVVDVSDTSASIYGTTKKANVDQFIGDKGEAATVDVGTTTTLSAGSDATVSNSGSTSAAVLDFGIPRGPQGVQGIQGVAGADGADGDSAYVYIAYASDASGTGFTTTFNAALDYIAVKATTTEITTPQASDFTGLWKNYKGATGAQGIQGETGLTGAAGVDGVNAYVYIAYASDNSGAGFTTTFDTNLDYVAIKATTTEIVTPQASDFTGLWKNYKGATGTQGLQGVPGTNGTNGTDGEDGEDGLDINWLGVYAGGTPYVVNDAVFYNGSSYICKLASTGNLPTETTYWDLMAQQGAAGSGSGDVSGPSSSTDNAIARYNLTTGKLIQDSLVTVNDDGDVNIPAGRSYLVNGSPVSGYSDEQAQDAVGTILTDTTTVDFTYTDETPSITADVKDASVTNAKLANMTTKTYKGRTSATTGVPEDVAVATLKTDLGLVKGDVGLGNVDNTSDATKNSATATLTNKTIDGDANTISNLAHGAEVDNPTSGVHGVTGSVVGTTDTQTLSAKTLTSPVINTGVSGTAVLDEDNMASDSATKLATQQSIKAYVDGLASTEVVQDKVGAMFTGNTETFIEATYQDADGTIDLVVPVKDEDNMASDSDTHVPTQQSVKAYVDAKGFTWEGAWATSTPYSVNDTVESNGSGYICTADHTSGASTEPGVGTSWTDKWDLFVEGIGGNSVQVDSSGGTSDTYGVLGGLVNSSNKVYTVSLGSYISGSLRVYLNGQLQTQGSSEDWTETTPASGTFTFATAPSTGDIIIAVYQFTTGATGNADTLDGVHASTFATKINPAMCKVRLGTTQENLTDTVYTKANLDTELYDIGSNFDTTNKRFVAPLTGYYQVNAKATFKDPVADKRVGLSIYVNGVSYDVRLSHTSSTSYAYASVSSLVYLQAGQYIELYAVVYAGANTVDLYGGGGADATGMDIHFVSL